MEQPNNNIMSISSGEEDNNNVYIHKQRKQRRDKKILDINEYRRNYYHCHKKYNQDYYKKQFICGCGKTITTGGKAKHMTSDIHQEYEHNLRNNIIRTN